MRKLIIACASLGFAAGAAFAQAPDFASVDTDGNGSVTMEEGMAAGFEWTEEQFNEADTDGDGALSAAEYLAATSG